jgi:hypothetical protein
VGFGVGVSWGRDAGPSTALRFAQDDNFLGGLGERQVQVQVQIQGFFTAFRMTGIFWRAGEGKSKGKSNGKGKNKGKSNGKGKSKGDGKGKSRCWCRSRCGSLWDDWKCAVGRLGFGKEWGVGYAGCIQ